MIINQESNYKEIFKSEVFIYKNGFFLDFFITPIFTILVFKFNGLYYEIYINDSTGDAIRINTTIERREYIE